MKQRVLVLGGAGFLGSHVIFKLLEKGYIVTNIDLNSLKIKHKNFIEKSVNVLNELNFFSKNKDSFDYIINFAGISDLDYCHNNPKESLTTNILSNLNIIDIFKDSKSLIKYIYASSAYASGTSGSFYAVGKKTCENIIKEYSNSYNLKYTILRYGSLYGIGSDNRNSIFRFITSALKSSEIIYKGTGSEIREFINVKDAADLTLNSLESRYDNQTLMLTGTKSMKYSELFDLINEIMGNSLSIKIIKNDSKTHYKTTPYSFDSNIVKKLTNNPHIDLGEGLIELMKEINENNKFE